MLATKDLYMKACMQSKELHAITDEERTRLQAHLREMYLEIEKVCGRHELKMCTGYGTVLGAVRHQGFIPWDDDMDLLMPREDYDKLINEYANELPSNYRIYAPLCKFQRGSRFAKVIDINTRFLGPGEEDKNENGVFIDIFPLEYAPKSKWLLNWRNNYTRFLLLVASSVLQYESKNETYKRLMCSSPAGTRVYKFRNFIGMLFSFKSGKGWNDRIATYTHYKKDTGIVNVPTDGGLIKSLISYPLDSYFPAKKVQFDDISVYVPKETEDYLIHNYGDWHWIPPVEERWQHFIKEIRL